MDKNFERQRLQREMESQESREYLRYISDILVANEGQNRIDKVAIGPVQSVVGTFLRLVDDGKVNYTFDPEIGSLLHLRRQAEYIEMRCIRDSEKGISTLDNIPSDLLGIAYASTVDDLNPKT